VTGLAEVGACFYGNTNILVLGGGGSNNGILEGGGPGTGHSSIKMCMKLVRYWAGRDIKVPPMMIDSTVSREWPRSRSFSILFFACMKGS